MFVLLYNRCFSICAFHLSLYFLFVFSFSLLFHLHTLMIKSMWWDYVSELWPPAGLLLIPHMIYEHGEPWWNDIHKWKLLIPPPELSQSYQQSSKSGGSWRSKRQIWPSRYLCSYFEVTLSDLKSYNMMSTALLPSEGRRAADFSAL
jgi:hypothetical protein